MTGYGYGTYADSNYVYWEVFPTTSTVVFDANDGTNASADLNGDGKINISDFYQMKRYLTSGELSTDN